MWNFREFGTWGVYQMFKPCSVWDWVLLLDGASRVIVVCVLGLWGRSQGSFFFSHQQICERLKVRGSCHFSCLQKKVEIGTWFGSEDRGGYGKHFGPVYSVKRNPFHVKFFLSVGDWCGKMWMEELKGGPLKDVVEWRVGSETIPILLIGQWSKLWKGPCKAGSMGILGCVCVYGIFSFSITKSQTHSQTYPETDPSNTPRNRHLEHTPQAHPETDTWHIPLTHIV